jgi:hypothetical protein
MTFACLLSQMKYKPHFSTDKMPHLVFLEKIHLIDL